MFKIYIKNNLSINPFDLLRLVMPEEGKSVNKAKRLIVAYNFKQSSVMVLLY